VSRSSHTSDDSRSEEPLRRTEQVEETSRPDTPELEGGTPLPEELTGRASGTGENLEALFENASAEHLSDGFRGGSGGDEGVAIPTDDKTVPDAGAS
jgi:hypothetical protein